MTFPLLLFAALLGGVVGGFIGALAGVCVAASFDRMDRETDRIDRPQFVPAGPFPIGPVTEVYP